VDKPLRGKKNVIVYCGQLIRGKGVDYLINSCAQIDDIEWELRIFGRGNDLNRLTELVKRLGLEDRVIFKGFESDLHKIYSQAKVFVFPSVWQEPFGLTGLEAMSFELPVVCFDVGGVREWLKDGENGFVVPLKDSRKMAMRIAELLKNPYLNKRMGFFGSKLAKELFNHEKFVNDWSEVINEKIAC
jgi:glycosyltransferase involved in cell wall biosynthesis